MITNEPEDATFKLDKEEIILKRDNLLEFLRVDKSVVTILDGMCPGQIEIIGTHVLTRVA